MKDAEDEAFDELAKKQGAWGGGFNAKRQAAMDKVNAEFNEEYIKYRTAFPKGYIAPQQNYVPLVEIEYNLSVADIKEDLEKPAQEITYAADAFWEKDGRIGVVLTITRPDGGVHLLQKTIGPPQSAQEPDWKDQYEKQKRRAEMWIAKYEKDIGLLERVKLMHAEPAQDSVAITIRAKLGNVYSFTGDYSLREGDKVYTTPPKREWVGLTDEDEIPWDGVDAKSFARAIEAKLKEKNNG